MNDIKDNEKFDIASARVKAKLTQEQMSKRLGMSKRTYIKYEKGENFLRIDKAWKLAEICNIPFDRIIFFKGYYTSSVVKEPVTE
ncbi:MAG: helix-turn-helix transcriptional regulator [Liquorilactobacillus hordei]|uniref:helix-turn-helix transcriptional regulator n=1 Tax=Liquorilactobacillus hordei TaxID=468911 RepID=UPI0039EB25ED